MHRRLPGLASAHGTYLVNGALSGTGLTCAFDSEDLDIEAFCALAARTEARILYATAHSFDAELFATDDEVEGISLDHKGRSRLAALRARGQPEHGRYTRLSVRFVAEGVLHAWDSRAAWHGDLEADLEELWDDYTVPEPQDPEVTVEEVDRLAKILIASPAFREATKRTERERVALQEHPGLRSCEGSRGLSRLGYSALYEASTLAEQEAKRTYADFAKRLPEIAAEAGATEAVARATKAPTRKAALRTFLIERSCGYQPTRDFIDLLHAEPALKSTAQGVATAPVSGLWDGVPS